MFPRREKVSRWSFVREARVDDIAERRVARTCLWTLLQFIYQANGHRSRFHLFVFFLWRRNSDEKTREHRSRARSMGINYHRVLSSRFVSSELVVQRPVSARLNRTKLNHSLKGDSRHDCTSRLSEFDPRAFPARNETAENSINPIRNDYQGIEGRLYHDLGI